MFGLAREAVRSTALNSAGVALGVLSLLVLSLATPAVAEGDARGGGSGGGGGGGGGKRALTLQGGAGDSDAGAAPLLDDVAAGAAPLLGGGGTGAAPLLGDGDTGVAPLLGDMSASDAAAAFAANGWDVTSRLSPRGRRAFGLCACVLAGALTGSTFTPPQFALERRLPGASPRLSDALFSHFSGILVTSVAAFAVYAAATRRPWVSPRLALPAIASGVCWGLATVCWFIANERLSIVVAFPIVTLGPGILSVLYGAIFYAEIKGARNALLVATACATFAGAAACIALSAQ
jgi:hypothetical protein